jgi:hypothetical protein
VYDGAKGIVVGRLLVLIIRERCQPDLPYQTLGFGAQMSYEVQNRQIVEGVEVEEVFGIEYGETFVIDQTTCAENVQCQRIGMRPAFLVEFFTNCGSLAVGVKKEASG